MPRWSATEPERTRLIHRRIISKVRVGDGCWEWQGAIGSGGYGQVRVNGRHPMAHRAVYELLVGPIPDGLQLDHLCRNRHCVRPDHLEPVTPKVNKQRGITVNETKTHCKHGHPFNDANTYICRDGSRACRACKLDWHHRNKDRRHV